MVSQDVFNQLKQENEQLHKELTDLNYLIELREEELIEIKNSTKNIAELQSKLDQNLYEFEHMQNHIETFRLKAELAQKRENSMEEEMLESIKMEQAYYQILEEYNSNRTALDDLNEKIKEITFLFQELKAVKSKNAELESNLEIAMLENSFLKEEIAKQKHQ